MSGAAAWGSLIGAGISDFFSGLTYLSSRKDIKRNSDEALNLYKEDFGNQKRQDTIDLSLAGRNIGATERDLSFATKQQKEEQDFALQQLDESKRSAAGNRFRNASNRLFDTTATLQNRRGQVI